MLRLDVGALVFLHAQLVQKLTLRAGEAQGQKHEVGRQDLLGPGDVFRQRAAILLNPFDLDDLDGFDAAGLVAEEPGGLDGIAARILAPERPGLLLAVIELVDLRPLRPGVVGGAVQRRPGDDLELHQALASLAQRRADAIGARVATADYNHVLAPGGNVLTVRVEAVVQELHGEVDTLQIPPRCLAEEIVGPGGAAAENNGIELGWLKANSRLRVRRYRFHLELAICHP